MCNSIALKMKSTIRVDSRTKFAVNLRNIVICVYSCKRKIFSHSCRLNQAWK